MSQSSSTPKLSEIEFIPLAETKAMELDYRSWVTWMRNNFSYSQSVRMCRCVGRKMPGHGFYLSLRRRGIKSRIAV